MELNDSNEPSFNIPDDTIIYPIISMVSVEPVKAKDDVQLNLFGGTFRINFSIFKKEKNGLFFFTCVIASETLPPHFVTNYFADANSPEARQFITKPLNHFEKFKRAILLFEDKPYTIKEFEDTATEWKKSLEGITK